ncbi:MAG: hypothetical protein LBF18_22880 [Pantoea sp.]|jgi:WD40 repeat protein|nr:hypothetical protein [Pantoea sp.]
MCSFRRAVPVKRSGVDRQQRHDFASLFRTGKSFPGFLARVLRCLPRSDLLAPHKLQDGSSPRTLKGHTKRVTSTHILASPTPEGPHKGRLVLSSSLDGTIRLWDVSTSSNERKWTLQQPVSKMVVLGKEGEGDEGSEASDVLRGKVALAAHTDGTVSLVDLSKSATQPSSNEPARVVLRTLSPSPINAISTLAGGWVVTGSRNGVVSLFRLSGLERGNLAAEAAAPLVSWSRTEGGSSILDVKLSKRLRTSVATTSASASDAEMADAGAAFSVLVAPSDGLAYRAVVDVSPCPTSSDSDLPPCTVRVVEEFVGPDCESTTCVREDEQGRLWISAGGTDGGLRVYERAG